MSSFLPILFYSIPSYHFHSPKKTFAFIQRSVSFTECISVTGSTRQPVAIFRCSAWLTLGLLQRNAKYTRITEHSTKKQSSIIIWCAVVYSKWNSIILMNEFVIHFATFLLRPIREKFTWIWVSTIILCLKEKSKDFPRNQIQRKFLLHQTE